MKHATAILAILCVVGLLGFSIWVGIQGIPTEAERRHVYRAGFSHPAITQKVGPVRDVSIATKQSPFYAKRRNDWERIEESDVVTGTVRLFILGTKEGGFVTLTYVFRKSDEAFAVTRLDISSLGSIPESNHSG